MRVTAFLFLAICLTLSILYFPSAAVSGHSAATGKSDQNVETRRGVLTTLWGDPLETETGVPPLKRFFLTDETGTIELEIDAATLEAAGGTDALDRQTVSVTGSAAPDNFNAGRQKFSATEIKLEKNGAVGAAHDNLTAPTASRPYVNILCRYSDSLTTTPKDPSFFTGLFANARPGLDHYFRDISYNDVDLAGTYTVGWFNLPQPRSYYFTTDPPNFQRMAADCTAAADALVDFSAVQGINLFFNQNTGCCAWGGSTTLTLDGATRNFPITYMPPGGTFQSILAHEMGHSFGWAHSANALGTTYASGWDVMSNDRYNAAAATDPLYGSVAQNTIAYNLDRVGWIPAARKLTAAVGTTTTINLERLSQPGANNYLMVQIPVNGTTDFYTVEVRYRTNYDAKLPNDAVVIHRVIPARTDRAWAVDPDGNADAMDAGGQWLPGETYTDATNRITVKVNSATTAGFNVTITNLGAIAATYAAGGSVRYGYADAGQTPAPVSGVTLNTSGTSVLSTVSNSLGAYQLPGLTAGGSYTVTPSKTGDVKGINSLDATRIQQHLVGLTTLTANQLTAADTDGSSTVNSLDATRIQQRAVGIAAPNIIGQWKFVPGSRQYNSISNSSLAENYEAVLVGEVSGNWATAASFAGDAENEEILLPPNNAVDVARRLDDELFAAQSGARAKRSARARANSQPGASQTDAAGGFFVNVSLPTNVKAATGAIITVPVTIGAVPAGTSIESFDFSLFYNPAVLQPVNPVGNSTGTLSAGCSVLSNSPTDGRVLVSGSCPQVITATSSGVLYNLQFTVVGSAGQTSALSFVNPANSTTAFQFNNGSPTAIINTGQFTVFTPTAAAVSVAGRVLTAAGRGIGGATITLTDASGNQRTAISTSFGYYRFDNVAAGETVTLSAKARRFSFTASAIVRTTDESIADADFIGAPYQ